jgi:uncharacterized protein YukE
MAKAAKQQDVEVTPKFINGILKDVGEANEQIDSARGKYMNAARRQRELIAAVYERAAAQGIPQKVMKLQVKIEQLQAKLTGAITELEAENRKILHKVVKAHGDKAQLALFSDLPPLPKEPKTKAAKKEAQADLEDVIPPADESNVHQLGAA